MGCPISMVYFAWGKLIIIFLCVLLSKTYCSILKFLLLINTGCLTVILGWIKIDMPDIIICDIRIRTCMLGNNWQGLFSIDINSEASCKLWSINKWKGLKIVIL